MGTTVKLQEVEEQADEVTRYSLGRMKRVYKREPNTDPCNSGYSRYAFAYDYE
jgi:hypothetical protein